MKNATDGFEVNADYLGRRLYSKPAVQEAPTPSFVDCGCFEFESRVVSDDALDAIPMETLELYIV